MERKEENMKAQSLFVLFMISLLSGFCVGECTLDHFIIGCNPDGIWGTSDDDKLFVDTWQKYRKSGATDYENWFYPLEKSAFPSSHQWRKGEPGFDAFQDDNPAANYTYDPNRCLAGIPDTDYSLEIRCVSLAPGIRAVHKEYPNFTIDDEGQAFNHSAIQAARPGYDGHMHLSYQAVDGESLFWVTWVVVDVLEDGDVYEASEPFTVVFNSEPLAGDLVVNGVVDANDLGELGYYWASEGGGIENDYFERADANRDGKVNFGDFAQAAGNWLQGSP